MATTQGAATVSLPRVAITYCTGCRWMLRAAYYAQELLTTFGNSIGEVALIPASGGTFLVHLTYIPVASEADPASQSEGSKQEVLLWDRKAEGGFPETKILKQKVRNLIEPSKDLGHSDKPSSKSNAALDGQEKATANGEPTSTDAAPIDSNKEACQDCR